MSTYKAKTSDKEEEGGETPSDDDDEGSNSKSDSSSDSSSNDSRDSKDDSDSDSGSNNNEDYDSQYSGDDWGAPPSDREDNDVDYYDGDIEDDTEADAEAEPIDIESGAESEEYGLEIVLEAIGEEVEEANNIDYDDYLYRHPSDWSCIIDCSSRSGSRYDKHGREIPELGSFHNSEVDSLTSYTKEEDDINARLATLDEMLMIHSFRNLTLESLEGEDEKMEGNESEYLPQYIHSSNKGKQDLFGEQMDSIERLKAYVTDKPTDMEIDGGGMDYMDENPLVLMLRKEGTRWEPPTIVKATTKLKNWAWEGAAHPMEDSSMKIKIVKPITLIKKIKTIEPVTSAKNIVSIPIESVSANIIVPVESVCDRSPIEFVSIEFVESVENYFPYNIISYFAYLLALNV